METHPPENLPAAIQELVRGQESARMLRRLLNTQQVKDEVDLGAGQQVSAAVLVGDVLRSFTKILSVLNSGEVSQVPVFNTHSVKSEGSEESSKSSEPRDRRGCYKRRKSSDSLTRLTPNLTDDGYQWRKYGQKAIQSTKFPRNYYRCTYKIDQGCPATKQVQMISNDPPMYRIIYHGVHICKTFLKPPQIILDCPSPTRDDSSLLLSFKTNNNGSLPYSSPSCRSSKTLNLETKEHTQQWMSMHPNDPSSDSSNYYLPSVTVSGQGATEVPSSSSYCSFDDHSDLIDVLSYY